MKMAKWIIAASLLFVLVGCGQESEEGAALATNYGYGWEYDTIGETGLRIRHYGDMPRQSAAEAEQLYAKVAACIAEAHPGVTIQSPAPLIIFVETLEPVSSSWALVRVKTATFLMMPNVVTTAYIENGFQYFFAHEAVHLILESSGILTPEENLNHYSPLFNKCVHPIVYPDLYAG